MTNFSGKNILVVGGSSGISQNLVSDLLEAGAQVFSVSRRALKAQAGLSSISLDVLAEGYAQQLAPQLPPVLHGVVYAPGSITLKPFNRLQDADFLQDFQINLLGAVRTLQTALPALRAAKGASVVLFSTVAVQVGFGFHASIAAAKGAVEGLARSLAAEWATAQIRVNCVAPSLTDTPLAANLLANDEKREASARRHPLQRIGTSEEVAACALFLLSADSAWITGQVLRPDGGMSSIRP